MDSEAFKIVNEIAKKQGKDVMDLCHKTTCPTCNAEVWGANGFTYCVKCELLRKEGKC